MASDQEMREWARQNGYNVGERGRLPGYVIAAYDRNNKGDEMTVTVDETTCALCGLSNSWHRAWCDFYVAPTSPVVPIPEVAPTAPETPILAPKPTPDLNTAAAGFAAAIAALAGTGAAPALDRGEVESIATDVFETLKDTITPRQIQVTVNENAPRMIDGLTHYRFEEVLALLAAGDNVYLVGPAGTGKSTLAKQCADALGVEFGTISCDSQMSSTALKGYKGATNIYEPTDYRRMYENGGVFLLDEADQSHPSPLTWLNMSLENGHCAFPDGYITRHPNFYVIVGANTYGTGATDQYVGANRQNAAFLDRFAFVNMDIDEKLEEMATLAEIPNDPALGRTWLENVRKWRKNAADQQIKILITPRAAIKGARLLATGRFTMERVAEMRVWKNVDANTRAKIDRGI